MIFNPLEVSLCTNVKRKFKYSPDLKGYLPKSLHRKHLLTREMSKRLLKNLYFLNYIQPASKPKIHAKMRTNEERCSGGE